MKKWMSLIVVALVVAVGAGGGLAAKSLSQYEPGGDPMSHVKVAEYEPGGDPMVIGATVA